MARKVICGILEVCTEDCLFTLKRLHGGFLAEFVSYVNKVGKKPFLD